MLTTEKAARQVAQVYVSEHAKRLASERKARARNAFVLFSMALFLMAAMADMVL